MPTFSAIQLDRYLEQGASKTTSFNKNHHQHKKNNLPDVTTASSPMRNTTSFHSNDDDPKPTPSRRQDIPPPHPQLRRRNSTSSPRVQMTPALYTTPEPTPLPDSPTSSFPPSSPFLINHKRRGPRLLKSLSDHNVAGSASLGHHSRSFSEESVIVDQIGGVGGVGVVGGGDDENKLGFVNGSLIDKRKDVVSDAAADLAAEVKVEVEEGRHQNGENLMRESGGENEDFYDPQDSMSFSGTADSEDNGGERSARMYTPMGGEFFDAWDELSSDSGLQAPQSLNDVETELREMRLSFLMEVEKRKQAEEALQNMQLLWQLLREKLGAVGLTLPAELTASTEDSEADAGSIEDICRQIEMVRFVSESIGRGIAKAEAQIEMESQLEAKNFEIARLCDRLHYYETMNREMSQRNQEAIENARLERQKRKRRQLWVWSSVGAASITLGTVALVWSYLSSGEGSSSSSDYKVPQPDSHVQ